MLIWRNCRVNGGGISFVSPPTEDYRYWHLRAASPADQPFTQWQLWQSWSTKSWWEKQTSWIFIWFRLHCERLPPPSFIFLFFLPLFHAPVPILSSALYPITSVHGSTVSPTVCFEAFHSLICQFQPVSVCPHVDTFFSLCYCFFLYDVFSLVYSTFRSHCCQTLNFHTSINVQLSWLSQEVFLVLFPPSGTFCSCNSALLLMLLGWQLSVGTNYKKKRKRKRKVPQSFPAKTYFINAPPFTLDRVQPHRL